MTAIFKNISISDEREYLGIKPQPSPEESTEPQIPAWLLLLMLIDRQSSQEAIYLQGFEAGCAQMQAEGLKAIDKQKNQLDLLLQNIPQAIADNRLTLQTDIADILLTIIQPWFIHNQKTPTILEQQINQILKELNHQHQVELYLHPEDLQLLQQGKMHLAASHLKGLQVAAEKSLTLGGCIIKSNHGVFKISIAEQISPIKV